MPRSLRGRLIGAFAIVSLAILFAVGGALLFVLRGLHQDATLNALGDVAGSVLPQVREAIAGGQLRGTVLELRDQLAERQIELVLIGADGRLRPVDGDANSGFGPVVLDRDATAGEQLKGSVRLRDGPHLYVATVLRRLPGATPKAVAFVVQDRSFGQALADVLRTLPIVVLAIVLVATPLAIALSRSVTRPLGRLAGAAGDIPSGRAARLPLTGPAEVRELTGTFNSMAAEIEATRTRERDLLANLRHDLRTPLTVITGFASALADGTASGDAATAAAKAIEEEAGRLERLVTEIGRVERIQSGEEQIRPELLDAGEVVGATVTRFGSRAAGAGLTLEADVAAQAPLTLAADRLALERMLGNLVENALAAARGSIVISAAAAKLPDDVDAIRLDVSDDGPGFPDGSASRAFERFWRGDPARAGTGSGLGLAIVRELALAHGGIAHAENRSPRGAVVSVTLPRVPWPAPRGNP